MIGTAGRNLLLKARRVSGFHQSIAGLISFNVKQLQACVSDQPTKLLQANKNFISLNRFKYDKKSTQKSTDEDETDSDEEIEKFKDERDSKVVKTNINSLRADLVLKAGLGLARNKVEVVFYDSKIRVNGKKILKKSTQLNVGDEVDVIKGFSTINPEHLIVGRVEILSATPKEENLLVALRRYRSLLVENYEGQNAWTSSS